MADRDLDPDRDRDQNPVIDVYWRPGCTYCMALRLQLKLARIPTRRHNIWADPDAAAKVRSVAGGNETVPTVVIGDVALVNPSVKQVRAALAAAGSAEGGLDR